MIYTSAHRTTRVGSTRREFLSTAAAIGLATTEGAWITRTVAAADVKPGRGGDRWPLGPAWEVEAVRVEQTFGDGTTLPFFRFRAVGDTASNGLLPLLSGVEGSIAELTVTNRLDRAIQPMVVGLNEGPVIGPGETEVMVFRVPAAGTWLLTDARLGRAAGPVGLGATVVSQPLRGPRAKAAAPPEVYDREYVLLYQDADDRWNLAVDAGGEPDLSIYEPNFHTVNGLTFPDTTTDADTLIACSVGERVLIRIANLGHVRQTIHFHGYHVEVATRNNRLERGLGMKDTVGVPGYTTMHVVLPVNQPGIFPVHPHSLPTTTDNGRYPFGQITLIQAT